MENLDSPVGVLPDVRGSLGDIGDIGASTEGRADNWPCDALLVPLLLFILAAEGDSSTVASFLSTVTAAIGRDWDVVGESRPTELNRRDGDTISSMVESSVLSRGLAVSSCSSTAR